MLIAERLVDLLRYDPDTGEFWWRESAPGRSVKRPAGCVSVSTGHRFITIDYQQYLASRLAWLYMMGEWPEREVDHRDLNPGNNRWSNLREATRSQNKGNSGLSKANTSGLKGVSLDSRPLRKPWRAQVTCQGKTYKLGYFPTKEAAKAAHDRKAAELFGEFARVD